MKHLKYSLFIVAYLMLCFNTSGAKSNRIWSTYVAPFGTLRADWPERALMACDDNAVYVASVRGIVLAIDAQTGDIKWKNKTGKVVPNGIATDGDAAYVGLEDGTFRAYNADDGVELWKMELRSAIVSAPTVCNGMVYFIIGDDTLYAVDAKTGKWKWQYKRDTRKRMTILGLPQPVIKDNKVFIGTSDGLIMALDALSGGLLWGKRPENTRRRFEDADSTPYVTESTVFLSTYDGKTYAVDRKSGNVAWSFDNGSIEPINVVDNMVIVSGQKNYIYALNAANGQKIWRITSNKSNARLTGAVAVGDKIIYGSEFGGVYVVNAADGKKIKRFATWGGVYSTPVVNDNRVYVLNGRGQIEAYEID